MIPSDLPAALSQLGLSDFQIRGEEIKAACPSGTHPDRHPSWSINKESGLHHCFSCGFSGDFAGLVMQVQGVDLDRALQWVLHLPLRVPTPSVNGGSVKTDTLLSLAGFSLPPAKFLEEKHLTAEACDKYELLFGDMCWIAPVRSPWNHNLWGYQKKSAVVKQFWFEPGGLQTHKSLFGYHLVKPRCRVILVESPIDAPRMYAAGVDGIVVSSFGASVTMDQIELLSVAGQLILALDNDHAGLKETARLLKIIGGAIRTKVFEYGDCAWGTDPGTMTDAEILCGVDESVSGLLWSYEC